MNLLVYTALVALLYFVVRDKLVGGWLSDWAGATLLHRDLDESP